MQFGNVLVDPYQSVLNRYEEYTWATTFTGPWTTTPAVNVYYTRIGRMIHVHTTGAVTGTYNGTPAIVLATAVPARFRPAATYRPFTFTASGAGNLDLHCDVTPAGELRFYATTAGAVYTSSLTIYPLCLTYPAA